MSLDTENTLDHAEDSILADWNAIRAGQDDEPADTPAAAPAEAKTTEPAAKEEKAEREPVFGRQRDATGKFAKTDPEAAPVIDPTLTAPSEGEAASVAAPAVDSPRSMPKELADKHWATLPPEVKAWTTKRDADYQAGISRYQERAQIADRIEAAASPYRATLEQLGATPDVALATFLSMDDVLRNGAPEAKAAMLAQLANQFGVPLQEVANVGPLQHQLLAREQELRSLRAQQTSSTQQQAQREIETLTSEVQSFSEGKEHFNAVQSEILALLPSMNQQLPNASAQEKLQRAYDIAIYANPTVRNKIEAARQSEAKAVALKQANEARRAASVNRTPRGVVAPAAKVGSMEDTIRDTARTLGLA